MIFILCKSTYHFFNVWAAFLFLHGRRQKRFVHLLCSHCPVRLCPKQKLLSTVRSGEYKF